MTLKWNSTLPGTRGTCEKTTQPINFALVVPVTACGLLILSMLAGLVWLWIKVNKERLVKSSGPPGAPAAAEALQVLIFILACACWHPRGCCAC